MGFSYIILDYDFFTSFFHQCWFPHHQNWFLQGACLVLLFNKSSLAFFCLQVRDLLLYGWYDSFVFLHNLRSLYLPLRDQCFRMLCQFLCNFNVKIILIKRNQLIIKMLLLMGMRNFGKSWVIIMTCEQITSIKYKQF